MIGNLPEIQDDLKQLSDQQVIDVAKKPTDPLYATLAVGELQRRKQMRTDYQARLAHPTSTVAQQLMGAPQVMPAPAPGQADPTQQAAPPAPQPAPAPSAGIPGMAQGGDVSSYVNNYDQLAQAAAAQPDPNAGLEKMIEAYRNGAAGRQRQDITQLLLRIGSGLMTSDRPDFLGALGEGAQAGVAGLGEMRQRQDAEARQGISDEGMMDQLASARQNNFIGGGLQALTSAGNQRTQLEVARIYAQARQARAAGLSSDPMYANLRLVYSRAGINYLQNMRNLETLQRQPYVDPDALKAAQDSVTAARQEMANAQRDMLAYATNRGVDPGDVDTSITQPPGIMGAISGQNNGPAQAPTAPASGGIGAVAPAAPPPRPGATNPLPGPTAQITPAQLHDFVVANAHRYPDASAGWTVHGASPNPRARRLEEEGLSMPSSVLTQ